MQRRNLILNEPYSLTKYNDCDGVEVGGRSMTGRFLSKVPIMVCPYLSLDADDVLMLFVIPECEFTMMNVNFHDQNDSLIFLNTLTQ